MHNVRVSRLGLIRQSTIIFNLGGRKLDLQFKDNLESLESHLGAIFCVQHLPWREFLQIPFELKLYAKIMTMWKFSREQKPAMSDTEPFLSSSDKIREEDSRPSLLPPSELQEFSKRSSRCNLYLCHILAISVNLILAVILLWQIQSSSWPRTSPGRLADYTPCIIYLSFIHTCSVS